MDLPAGLVVAIAILGLLPVGAVWAAQHWRDPPREKWGIPADRLEAARNSPELVAYRRRIELGVTHGPRLTAVNRAIATGTAAPPELRSAAHELAQEKVREIDGRMRRSGAFVAAWLVTAAILGAVAIVLHVVLAGVYAVLYAGRAVAASPYLARRRRARAEAAVLANAP